MFLVLHCSSRHIIKYILVFIEEHSVLVGVITSVIASSLWLRKFLKQKRAEAFFGFYAKLSLRLKALQTRLEEDGQLNTSDSETGNIYTLLYLKENIGAICPKYTCPRDEKLQAYQEAAKELKNILLSTECNVYPPGATRNKWYASQYVVFAFCEYLENDQYRHITNQEFANGDSEPKHISKCKALVEAMQYLQLSIERAKY